MTAKRASTPAEGQPAGSKSRKSVASTPTGNASGGEGASTPASAVEARAKAALAAALAGRLRNRREGGRGASPGVGRRDDRLPKVFSARPRQGQV